MSATESLPPVISLAELIHRLGDIPLERIPAVPPPGTAKEQDVLRRPGGEKRLYELVDGVLVEKPMGYYESLLAAFLLGRLQEYLRANPIGEVLAPDATMRLLPGLVRLPDVAFVSWERAPEDPETEAIPDVAPDLAVEVISRGNTRAEMERKLDEYFAAGVRGAWLFDPRARTVRVYTSRDQFTTIGADGTVDGGDVLPGFQVSVAEWLASGQRRKPAGCVVSGIHPATTHHSPLTRPQVSLAICRSSSVGMTHTGTGPALMQAGSFPTAWFRAVCSRIPRNSRPAQIRSRIAAECSPMPAVKATASSPPRAAA
jgi:Uma2 family endonuclease